MASRKMDHTLFIFFLRVLKSFVRIGFAIHLRASSGLRHPHYEFDCVWEVSPRVFFFRLGAPVRQPARHQHPGEQPPSAGHQCTPFEAYKHTCSRETGLARPSRFRGVANDLARHPACARCMCVDNSALTEHNNLKIW
jgi:hypothetical protein